MVQKKRLQQLSKACLGMAQMLEMSKDDDSDETKLLTATAFNSVTDNFREYTITRNKCEDDVPLTLTRIEASNDFIVVWLHHGEPLENDIQHDSEVKLRCVFASVQIFTDMEACLDFLEHLDPDHTHLIFISSCFYDGKPCGARSPLADPKSDLARVLKRFAYEYHYHGHGAQWSSPNYVYSLSEQFIDIKCQHDAKKLLLDESDRIPYKIIWLRTSLNDQFEKCLMSAFDSLEIYEDRAACLDYLNSVDRSRLSLYLIAKRDDVTFDCKNVRTCYFTDSYQNINRVILQIRSDILSDTTSPIRPIERSARFLSENYAPFISLISNLDLHLALSRNIHDHIEAKDEMLRACRLVYQNNEAELNRINEFEKKYNHDPDSDKKEAIFWYTRDSFVYRLVNQALRTGDPDVIHPYRFFINDLYSELLSIHRQYIEPDEEDFIVYRGQGLTLPELTSLRSSVGKLVTFASFISSTVDRELAYGYAKIAARKNVVSAFFEFHINTEYNNTRPYAYVADYSAIRDEYEVLISVGTIFRLNSVVHDMELGTWILVLSLCQQHDEDIKHLVPTNGGIRKIKFVNFCSTKETELTFHETLKRNLLLERRSLSTIRVTSLPTLTISISEEEKLHIRRQCSIPSKMSESVLDLHKMNWGKKSGDCTFLNWMKRKRKSDSNQLLSLLRRSSVVKTSLPNLSSIKFCDILAITVMKMLNPFMSLIEHASTKPRSLPNLSVINFTATEAKFAVIMWKMEMNDQKMNDDDKNVKIDNPLFLASIHDILMLCTEDWGECVTDSMSLKDKAALAMHDMRYAFNIDRGRWCDEY
ncbi:unnamed protein product [Rotaria magnacalcarata]|uniref:Uncharacterized protein n=2 Tax=Rotaria magnacalcarata TaxID=392030 RepID=A0A816V687_9BILA|nr:unnamed protein product [Rotaria magnacalcarata]CAF3954324.1 unnamed protein product [Rotaria magnacalcarata]